MNFTVEDLQGNGWRTVVNAAFAEMRGIQSKLISNENQNWIIIKKNYRLPRPHEYGGTYGQGVLVRKYNAESVINVRVELTASHSGYFQFALCPNFKNTTQECLDQNILKLLRPQEGKPHDGTKYFPMDGNRVYEMKYKLPKLQCKHCVMQWKYISGKSTNKNYDSYYLLIFQVIIGVIVQMVRVQ